MKIKNRNKKKQKLLQRIDKKYIGFHVYRSVNENLPFIFWERLTDEPIKEGDFNDQAAEIGQRYFCKLTQVDANGKESAPITPKSAFTDHAGNTYTQNPLIDFAGYNIYRSAQKECRSNNGNAATKSRCQQRSLRMKASNRARFIFITFAPLIRKERKARRLKLCALSENKRNFSAQPFCCRFISLILNKNYLRNETPTKASRNSFD